MKETRTLEYKSEISIAAVQQNRELTETDGNVIIIKETVLSANG